jgi:hypothetical protein
VVSADFLWKPGIHYPLIRFRNEGSTFHTYHGHDIHAIFSYRLCSSPWCLSSTVAPAE